MRIEDITTYTIREAQRTGRESTAAAGSNGAWRALAEPGESGEVRIRIWHYSTLMAVFIVTATDDVDPDRIYLCEGWGSTSDVQGMNKVFRALGVGIEYRAGEYRTRGEWAPIVRDRFGVNGERVPEWAV
jgi:hypothetical protein